ncbi:acyl-CoA desaturase [Labrys wisconsinensis]|uniref:Stearoyl-CoA desaturase (Delta-9 desaturase) n=1 Tax=Labrys wisconsinensis TaxID=425677 RepID=A0ABU0IZJ5_9HYPH|nr:acyl-CoA desaturase [Labrys wisconsinensis]MDQ0467436.1 stearoyl-CoA desaturase (delta-9 desaturase) [Labrys wisconsinensis]
MRTLPPGYGIPGDASPAEPPERRRDQALEADLQNAASMHHSPRMTDDPQTDAMQGTVRWAPVKSIWWTAMALGALVGAPLNVTWGAFALFLVTTATTICLGHSLGMHRRLIHRSYDCPLWLERLFVYCGTLVGMAGPSGIIRQHDIRDWAQRRPGCHAFLAHRNSILKDGFWQLHCELRLDHPPVLTIERRVREDRFYRLLDRTVMAQQAPWALAFWAIGGWPWLFWGIAMRVFLSLTGHWLVGYFAHNRGPRTWHVEGAGVQGYNVPRVGFLTMGEAWHNNHHAFPASARLGLHAGETDPGWWVLVALRALGLVWNVRTPETLPSRAALRRIDERGDAAGVGAVLPLKRFAIWRTRQASQRRVETRS